jgi:predicted kinase
MTKLIMLCGLPASGKSTIAKQLKREYNANIISPDELRNELFGTINEQNKNEELFKELSKRVKNNLINNNNTIIDATNVSHKRRKIFLDELNKIDCKKICYIIATPYEKCIEQNQLRDRKVPDHVIKKMYLSFYIPQKYEGWDEIKIVWNFNKYDFNLENLFVDKLHSFKQDNSHHTLTVGSHCHGCAKIIQQSTESHMLFTAGLLHDIGKPFTKTFVNTKGETTNEAHYYQHHLISAYDAMFYLNSDRYGSDDSILEVCNYVQWHMQPFDIKTEKAKNKFINLVGKKFYDNLMILHEADIKAK